MSSHEDLDAILKRLEDGTQTEADVAALRQLLRGEGRSEVVQQLAKYNIHMDKAEGIQIGDRYYNTPKPENAEVDFRRYLRSVTEEYQHWWEKYTLTDALSREKRKEKGRSPSEWNFDLMVQTARRQEPEEQREEKEKIERFPVLEGLRKYAKEHVLLVGRPGSGKSTALVMLLLEEAALTPLPPSPNSGRGGSRLESEVRSQVPQTSEVFKTSEVLAPASLPSRIPVLVELRFWQTSILDRILKFLQKHDPELNLSEQTVEALLKQGRLLLLVDGLNELPSEEARRDVARFRNDYRKTTPMIFTTRELSVGGDLGIEKKLEMQPLTEGQMRSFVKAYLPERGDALLAQLKDRLRELGQTPLLLAMLCSIFQNTEQLPNNLGEVFRQFTQFYENGLKQDVPVSDESRHWWRPLLERLAFVMMHEDSRLTSSVDFRVAISQREALETFREFLQGEVNDPGDRAIECLDDLLKHHLIQINGDRIEFRHQMIQEYYAAEYLLRLLPKLTDEQLKCDYLNYLKWTGSAELMLALMDEEAKVLRVVKLVMHDLDIKLGAKLAGQVKPVLQAATVGLINLLEIPMELKIILWSISCSEEAIPELLQILEHQEPEISLKVVYILGKINSDRAFSEIIKVFEHQNSEVRFNAITALGHIGNERAVALLLKALAHSYSDIRIGAAYALSQIGSEQITDALLKTLDDQDPTVRTCSTWALCMRDDERRIDILHEALTHQYSDVRVGAVWALERIGNEQATTELIKVIEDPDINVCFSAILALGRINSEQAVMSLIKALEHPNRDVAWGVILELSRINSEQVIESLLNYLDHKNLDIRKRAIYTLHRMSNQKATIGLLKAICDPDISVDMNAVLALMDIGSEQAIVGLLEALSDRGSDLCVNVIKEMGKVAGGQKLVELVEYVENLYYKTQVDALRISEKEAHNPMSGDSSEAADNQDLHFHEGIKYGSKIDQDQVIIELFRTLEGGDLSEIERASEALQRIGGERVLAALVRLIESEIPNVREESAQLLGRTTSGKSLTPLYRAFMKRPTKELSMTIAAIQSRCKFYNYELYQQAQSQAEESDRPQTTQPIVQMIFNERVYGVAGNVEGDFNNQGLPSAKLDDNKK